jgi:BirA family biotin operon repressor/biotin-[acetyl-CoA-carboxylase] ligase
VTRFSSDLQSHATSLNSELNQQIKISDFLKKFFLQFTYYHRFFKENRYENIVNQWKLYSDTIGKNIRIQTASETLEGFAFDVDPSGFLLVKSKSGDIKKIMSGDCLYLDELDHT